MNLTQGSSYLPLPNPLRNKRAVINPKNENDEECFKWAVIAALHYADIRFHPERILNLRKFEDNYDWSGLEFTLSIKGISEFVKKTDIIINVSGVKENKFYILKGKKYDYSKKAVNLLLKADRECMHYTAIK